MATDATAPTEAQPFTTIPLTRGMSALIDAADEHLISDVPWHAHPSGSGFYAAHSVYVPGSHPRLILMHRRILGITDPDLFGDHKDGDGLNNRRSNLRIVTRTINARNTGVQRNNSSGFVGVTWSARDQKWQARIMADGKSHSLGMFLDPKDANAARLAAEARLWGVEPQRSAAHLGEIK